MHHEIAYQILEYAFPNDDTENERLGKQRVGNSPVYLSAVRWLLKLTVVACRHATPHL